MFGSQVETDRRPGSPVVWTYDYEGKPHEDKGQSVQINANRSLELTHCSAMQRTGRRSGYAG